MSGLGDPGAFRLASPLGGLVAGGVREVLEPETAHGAAGAALAMARRAAARGDGPGIVVGAIGFDADGPARFWVPEHAERVPSRGRARRELSGRIAVPEDAHYRAAVAAGLSDIAGERLRKVVLARAVDVRTETLVDLDALYDTLAEANPEAYAFSADLGDDGVLLGASPELLVRVDGRIVTTNPLAGSTPRGATPADDEAARSRLAVSAKDLGEHRVVVEAVEAALGRLSDDIDVPPGPSTTATEHLWHLSTTISGRLRQGVTALDAAYALHPTPAVCGAPSLAAARLIRAVEGTDRGYFAGLVGWMDADGDGEWVLALRCGLVRGDHARVHAGAGVVAASTPEGEHAETATKLQTFLLSLQAVAGPLSIEAAVDEMAAVSGS